MGRMFYNNSVFNQNIGSWDVSNITGMTQMFASASNFNNGGSPSISGWSTSSVTLMNSMFSQTSFNQPISGFNISNVTDMTDMLSNSNLDTTNYSNLLIGWASQAPSIQTGVTLGASGRTYSIATAQSSRNTLTGSPYNWVIVGDTGI
jgi:surface protein